MKLIGFLIICAIVFYGAYLARFFHNLKKEYKKENIRGFIH